MVTGNEPPVHEGEGVVRLTTPEGVASVEIVTERPRVRRGETVRFELVNRGDVTLAAGRHFEIEHWNGLAWTSIPVTASGRPMLFTDDLLLLRPGHRGVPAEWPCGPEERRSTASGWYRIVKFVYRERSVGSRTLLTVRTRFQVVERR